MPSRRTFFRTLFLVPIFFFITVVQAQFSKDALILTLRVQPGVLLDSALAVRIDSSLAAARSALDTLNGIHAFPDYVPNQILLGSTAEWSAAWRREEVWTGDPYIDSLGTYLGLVKVDTFTRAKEFILTFDRTFEARKVSALYAKRQGVAYAEPNSYCCDGDNIVFFRKNETDHFAFSHGWGDCMAGCIERFYWYVTVSGTGNNRTAVIEDSGKGQFKLKIHRWNIPARYAVTMFPTFDSLISAVTSAKEWWVRRHAVEALKRLYQWNYPWVGEDLHKPLWDTLRAHARHRKQDVLTVLNASAGDPDLDVKSSVTSALNVISLLSVPADAAAPVMFDMDQNYPNPFNPSTVIRYRLSERSRVSLSVTDLLGRRIAELVNEQQEAGEYRSVFAGDGLSGGFYLYRLTVEGRSIVKKMLLMK
jgi:hypothetical protein